jgi:3-oxoacyl-[acyl-carrier protein] reductase
MGRLEGKRALVTGSSSGIGAGVAAAFAREGADVVINYPSPRQESDANGTLERIRATGRKAAAIRADVSDAAQVEELVAKAVATLGGIDILVNNAGIAGQSPIEELAIDAWDRMIAVHLRGTFLVTRLVLPMMYRQEYGKIVNTASQLAYKGAPGSAHYTAAKAGIIGFTRSLALEIGPRHVTANCVGPGATNTPLLSGFTEQALEAIRANIPRGQFAEIDEIVPTYVFLASDESRNYQGQCLSPNGGDVFL